MLPGPLTPASVLGRMRSDGQEPEGSVPAVRCVPKAYGRSWSRDTDCDLISMKAVFAEAVG